MGAYTKTDCEQTGYDFSIKGKVVVLDKGVLAPKHPGQLFLCMGGNGANPNPVGRSVFLVSLTDGEPYTFYRGDVLGTLKPELLPDEEKLMLSQIRPAGAKDLKDSEPEYSGYSFLADGRYAAGVWLCDPKEVMAYVEMQKPYQHKIMICDRDDFAVLEIVEGKVVYPDEQTIARFQKEQESGMSMT